MVDVALIHPPVVLSRSLERQVFHPILQPGYGMLHIAQFLLDRGYRVKVWNIPELFSSGHSEKSINQLIFRSARKTPFIVGIELNWVHQSRGAIELAEMLKKHHSEAHILLGGMWATLFAREIATKYSHCVDGILRGESELSFLDYTMKIEGDGSLRNVSGLTRAVDGKLIENDITRILEDIDKVPPYSLQKTIGPTEYTQSAAINTCRGPCPRQCIYCIAPRIAQYSGRKKMVHHSPKWIITQISLLIDEGCRNLFIQDDLFVEGRKTLVSMARAIRKEKLNEKINSINMVSAPGFLDRKTLKELSLAGVDNIDYGMESGSQKVLDLAKRNVTVNQIKDSVRATTESGIIPMTWWMIGFPGESREDVEKTANLIKDTIGLGGVPRWVTPIIAVPGSELYDNPERYGVKLRIKSFENFKVFSVVPRRPSGWYPELITHETEHLSFEDISEMAFLLKMLIKRRSKEVLIKIKERAETFTRYYHGHISPEDLMRTIENLISQTVESFN